MPLFKSSDVARYQFRGDEIVCHVCNHDVFFRQDIELTDTNRAFFGLSPHAEGNMVCLVCDLCRYVMWFYEDKADPEAENGEAVDRIESVVEGDYEKYAAGLDRRQLEDVMANIDRGTYPRKYRIVKAALKALTQPAPSPEKSSSDDDASDSDGGWAIIP